jgi:hypothetical protein
MIFIAAKYEQILAPGVDEFVLLTHKAYLRDEILKGERIVLQTLDFKWCSAERGFGSTRGLVGLRQLTLDSFRVLSAEFPTEESGSLWTGAGIVLMGTSRAVCQSKEVPTI